MAEPIVSIWDPLPVQRAFRESKAKIRGYGGAMGGGKSRTGCEEVFDIALDHPGRRRARGALPAHLDRRDDEEDDAELHDPRRS